MKRHKTITLAVVAALVLMAGSAFAASITDTLNVTATTVAACTISSTGILAFGNYDPSSGTPLDGSTTTAFKCTKGTVTETLISVPRTMTDGTDTLNYELYTDAPGGTVWPDTTPGFAGASGSVLVDITQTIFGRIAINQDVGVGGYTGSATITVNY
jgi:spore coat protein U-like protein